MKLLQELLTINFDRDIDRNIDTLLEDLGNLKKIDKFLMKQLMKSKSYSDFRGVVKDALGQNSEVVAIQDVDFYNFEDKDVVALVIVYGGKQIAMIHNQDAIDLIQSRHNKKPNYSITMNDEFNKIIAKDQLQAIDKYLNGHYYFATDNASKIKKIIKLINNTAKQNDVTVSSLLIKADKVRSDKQEKRAKN